MSSYVTCDTCVTAGRGVDRLSMCHSGQPSRQVARCGTYSRRDTVSLSVTDSDGSILSTPPTSQLGNSQTGYWPTTALSASTQPRTTESTPERLMRRCTSHGIQLALAPAHDTHTPRTQLIRGEGRRVLVAGGAGQLHVPLSEVRVNRHCVTGGRPAARLRSTCPDTESCPALYRTIATRPWSKAQWSPTQRHGAHVLW